MERVFMILCMLFTSSMLFGGTEKADTCQLKEINAFDYAALELTGSYEQHEAAFQTLYEATEAQELSTDKMPFGIYYDNPEMTPEDSLRWELGIPVTEDQEVKEPLARKTWPFTTILTMPYEGPFNEEMEDTYMKMMQWIDENGYHIAGPIMEKYSSEPYQNENGVWTGKVKIVIPVKK